jgi:outer membrane protein TolC
MAESREKEVLTRVGYEARKAAQAVSQYQEISFQLILASTRAGKAAELAGRAYEEGETSLTAWLQARRQASEAQLSATLAQVDAFEAMARAMLDAHQIWTAPTPEVLGLH